MEGYDPTVGCATGCQTLSRGWVPFPRNFYPRRDALIDAFGRTSNPCERPARCGPCCEATPKFRLPKEQPACNLDCYREEQCRAKQQQRCEDYQKFVQNCCPPPPCPEMIIEPLDPQNPIAIELEDGTPPEYQPVLRELPCRTNIIAGHFNPDDNKTPEDKLREACDRTYLSCGPNLPLYPCRGVIQYPRRIWTTLADEQNTCAQLVCQGTKYCDPEYQEQQQELKRQRLLQIQMEQQMELEAEMAKQQFFNPNTVDPCCADMKLSQTSYCNCGCDMNNFMKQSY